MENVELVQRGVEAAKVKADLDKIDFYAAVYTLLNTQVMEIEADIARHNKNRLALLADIELLEKGTVPALSPMISVGGRVYNTRTMLSERQ